MAMTSSSFRFGSFILDLDRQCLRSTCGQVALRPKSFDVLRYLVEHAGRVVTKEEVLNAVWPNVTVTDESLTRCISEVRRALGDDSQGIIKTVSKRGYLFDLPIATNSDGPVETFAPGLPLPKGASIAVLPFANLSGDAAQEYFADGIVEDVITELSRFADLFVIARNSTFQYKGKAVEVRQVGGELGVRYVVEGSVRRSGDRVRVAVQLIDTESGGHLWAQKYDHDFADIMALQDRITESVVAAIEPQILIGEGARAARKRPANLDAFDCCMRALWHYHQLTPDENQQAQRWLRRSLELDPTLARAHSLLSRVLALSCWAGYSDNIDRDLEASLAAAERGVALDDRDAHAHYALSIASLFNQRHTQALAAARRAIELNPNFALGYFALGEALVFTGHFAEAFDPLGRCLRLSPQDPLASVVLNLIALGQYHLGNYEESVYHCERALQMRRSYVVLRTLAAALGQLGRIEEVRSVLAEMDSIRPTRKGQLALLTPYADLSHEAQFLAGLRKAGLPANSCLSSSA
jgi:TolB-like protein